MKELENKSNRTKGSHNLISRITRGLPYRGADKSLARPGRKQAVSVRMA